MLVFEERGKLVYPEKTFQNKGENQKQTRSSVMYASTFGTQTWGMLVGGKCSYHYATLVSMACGQRRGHLHVAKFVDLGVAYLEKNWRKDMK